MDSSEKSKEAPLLARARYNNVAEAQDELSFRQGDVVTVVQKDYNGQVDWWLCQLHGKVGMVPANYFEVFHQQALPHQDNNTGYDHDPTLYDVPKSNPVSPYPDDAIYDMPPADPASSSSTAASQMPNGGTSTSSLTSGSASGVVGSSRPSRMQADYDFPPVEAPDYDRPPSQSRSSTKSPFGSSRLSQASNNSSIYDIPPDSNSGTFYIMEYDTPKPHSSVAKKFEEEEKRMNAKRMSLHSVDVDSMYDEEAEQLLSSYRQLIETTYESLFQTVYGPEAYWGTDNKSRKMDTLQRTTVAAKYFDKALTALLEFGKGVSNTLENCSDLNFKKKFAKLNQALAAKRSEVEEFLEMLTIDNETLTASVKSLLEVAKSIPSSFSEFAVLIQANKALLFKVSQEKTQEVLPVLTHSEVKRRPLPELPAETDNEKIEVGGDYAMIPNNDTLEAVAADIESAKNASKLQQMESLVKKRNPQDKLPPLPFVNDINKRRFGTAQSKVSQQKRDSSEMDYDVIQSPRNRTAVNFNQAFSPMHQKPQQPSNNRVVRRGSLGSTSASSDENINSSQNHSMSNPYMEHSNLPSSRSPSPHQPIRREDRELLGRFSQQMELLMPDLKEAMEVFILSANDKEPPKEFIVKSKMVVVSAYKLVYIADALTHKVLHSNTKASIVGSSIQLTEMIKTLVMDTKTAALQYPSVMAGKKMVDSVRKLFPLALDVINTVKMNATYSSSV